MPVLRITDDISIDESEIGERFVQSSGPGGQNVNKVATAVELRFDARRSRSLPDAVAIRLMKSAAHLLTQDGVVVIKANRFRTQERNRADARERLADLIREAAAPPPPKRIATRPSLSSRRERVDTKKRRSETKRGRSRPQFD